MMAPSSKLQKLWWTVPAAGLLVLVVVVALVGKPPEPKGKGTSFDSSPEGYRAAYLLLEELGYPAQRSRRPLESGVRWVLFPNLAVEDARLLDGWVREGGRLLLADVSPDFAHHLGMELVIDRLDERIGDEGVTGGKGIEAFLSGSTRVAWPGEPGRVWLEAESGPVITIYDRGRGQIWLVNRPQFLKNRWLGEADNAVLVCRLADAMLEGKSGPLEFDEYFHGLRERPGVIELLLQPPALWVTIQGVFGAGLLLWRFIPRFGSAQPAIPLRRRSKEEFLDAVASLMERKDAVAQAYRTVRGDLIQEMQRDLGLPGQAGLESLVHEIGRRRFIGEDVARRVLSEQAVPSGASRSAFLIALNELESLRDEFFQHRPAG
jgi:hypothetical protein